MQPDQAQLDELVRRIVEAVHPLKIILFGSAACGEMGPDSDVDILVVVPDETDPLRAGQFLHTRFRGLKLPVDVVVCTGSELDRLGRRVGLVYREALAQGREVYAA